MAPQKYVWANAILGGVEYATGIVWNPKHPELLYSKNDTGSIYRLDRKHRRWVSLLDSIPWNESNLLTSVSIGLDANDTNVVYSAGGGSQWDSLWDIVKTTDGGKHWARTHLANPDGSPVAIYQGDDKPAGERLAVDPNDSRILFFGSQRDGLFKSSDAAKTWHPVLSFPTHGGWGTGLTFVTFDWKGGANGKPTRVIYVGVHAGPASTKAGAASVPGGVYRSLDSGQTWTTIAGWPSPAASPLKGRLSADGTLYVPCVGSGGLWKFRGNAWTDITPAGFAGHPFGAVGTHPKDPSKVLAMTFDDGIIFYSKDAGSTWTQYKHVPHNPKASNVVLGFEPAWELTDDKWPRGYTSSIEFDPINPAITYETDFSGANVGTGIGTPKMTWSLISAGREQITCGDVLSPSAGAPLISGVWDVGGFRHTDLSSIPGRVIPLLPGNPQGQKVYQDIFQLDANPIHPNNLVAAGGWQWNNTGDASYSNDNGRTLHNFPTKPFPEAKYGRIAQGIEPANVVWAPMGTAQTPIYFTRDNGVTWTAGNGGPLGTIATDGPWSFYKELAADRVRAGCFYLYDRRDGSFYRSEDGGANWNHVSTLPRQQGAHFDNNRVLAMPGIPGTVWTLIAGATAVGRSGLYVSHDGGDNWTRQTGVQWPVSFSFGKGRPGGRYPSVYLFAQIGGPVPKDDHHANVQLYRSDDMGSTWTQINDAGHQLAGMGSMAGDNQVWGRVYVSTGGRGIFYGRPDAEKN